MLATSFAWIGSKRQLSAPASSTFRIDLSCSGAIRTSRGACARGPGSGGSPRAQVVFRLFPVVPGVNGAMTEKPAQGKCLGQISARLHDEEIDLAGVPIEGQRCTGEDLDSQSGIASRRLARLTVSKSNATAVNRLSMDVPPLSQYPLACR